MPAIVKARLFGSDLDTKGQDPSTLRNLVRRCALQRKAPIIHVYVVSAVTDARLQAVEFLFHRLPVCIWRLKHSDFFSSDNPVLEGTFASMGVDRVASLQAAVECYGAPTLVIDGGTTLAYTALDGQGAMLGGGLLAGVDMRLASLKNMTGQLPYICPKELMEDVNKRIAQTHTPPLLERFAKKSTHDSIVAGMLYEMADTLVGIVYRWKVELERRQESLSLKVTNQATNDGDTAPSLSSTSPRSSQAGGLYYAKLKQNKNHAVVVAGGDGSLICQLLCPGHSGIIAPTRGAEVLNSIRVVNEQNVRTRSGVFVL